MRTKPAISSCERLSTVLPTAAAPAPSTTKMTVKPKTNGMLDATTRRATLRSPSLVTSTADSADR